MGDATSNQSEQRMKDMLYYEKYPTTEMRLYMYTVGLLIVAALGFLAAGENEIVRANSHVFMPTEVNKLPPKLDKEIKQPDYDEIFDKTGKV